MNCGCGDQTLSTGKQLGEQQSSHFRSFVKDLVNSDYLYS